MLKDGPQSRDHLSKLQKGSKARRHLSREKLHGAGSSRPPEQESETTGLRRRPPMRLYREAREVILPANPAPGRPQQLPASKKPVSKMLLATPACEEGLDKAGRCHSSRATVQPKLNKMNKN